MNNNKNNYNFEIKEKNSSLGTKFRCQLQNYSLISKKISSKEFSKKLVNNYIATRNDNFYAWRCLQALGINTDDGVIRISMAHYNSLDERNNLIEALNKI